MRKVYYGDLEFVVWPSVYEPSDDTYLLASNLKIVPGQKVLEIGTGCGMVAILSAMMGGRVTATDISEEAIKCARANAERYGLQIEFLVGDLFQPVKKRTFDVVIFNPPYLPSSSLSQDDLILRACEGGPDGRVVVDAFLDELPSHLEPGGEVYLVQSSLSDAGRTEERLRKLGFELDIERKKLWFEELFLFRGRRLVI